MREGDRVTGDFVEAVRDRVAHAREIRHVAVAIDLPAVEAMLFLLEHPPVTIEGQFISDRLEEKAKRILEDREDGFGNT